MKVGDMYIEGAVPVGTRIKFATEKQAYVVQASNVAFSVCNKPLNMIRRLGGKRYKHEKTVLYTIINWYENVRGAENLVFGMGAENKQDCEEMLERLTRGDSEVSYRNRVPLVIDKVVWPWKEKRKK